MIKTKMKRSREYLCLTRKDSNGKAIRDSYGNLVTDYREEDVYRVRVIDNGGIYYWCIHRDFEQPDGKGWIISDCGTGLKMCNPYRTRAEAYEHINEDLFSSFLKIRKTDFYNVMYNKHNNLRCWRDAT